MSGAVLLCACGTEIARYATGGTAMRRVVLIQRMVLLACDAACGTEMAYGYAACASATQRAVLRKCMAGGGRGWRRCEGGCPFGCEGSTQAERGHTGCVPPLLGSRV
eukprot:750373-Rhodomonas_salina.1